jgi:hypothetical protein
VSVELKVEVTTVVVSVGLTGKMVDAVPLMVTTQAEVPLHSTGEVGAAVEMAVIMPVSETLGNEVTTV